MKVRQASDGRWIADLRVKGKGPQLRCDSKAEAEKVLAAAILERDGSRSEHGGMTLAEAIDDFIATCKANEYARNTLSIYRQHLDNHVLPRLPKLMADIDVKTISTFRADPPSVLGKANRYAPFLLLGQVFAEAYEAGSITRNPFEELPDVRRRQQYNRPRSNQRLRLPAPAEWQACVDQSSGTLHLMICLALLAGLRIGEILALVWEDVDLKKRRIRIRTTALPTGPKDRDRQGGPKTSERRVPMSLYLRKILTEHKNGSKAGNSDLVFQNGNGGPLLYNEALSMLQKLMRRLGIMRTRKSGTRVPAFCWHAFRHACVARWIYAKNELSTIMRWIGHKNPTLTLDIYAYVIRDRSEHRRNQERNAPAQLNASARSKVPASGSTISSRSRAMAAIMQSPSIVTSQSLAGTYSA